MYFKYAIEIRLEWNWTKSKFDTPYCELQLIEKDNVARLIIGVLKFTTGRIALSPSDRYSESLVICIRDVAGSTFVPIRYCIKAWRPLWTKPIPLVEAKGNNPKPKTRFSTERHQDLR